MQFASTKDRFVAYGPATDARPCTCCADMRATHRLLTADQQALFRLAYFTGFIEADVRHMNGRSAGVSVGVSLCPDCAGTSAQFLPIEDPAKTASPPPP